MNRRTGAARAAGLAAAMLSSGVALAAPPEARVSVRECAGVARTAEPVTVKAGLLGAAWKGAACASVRVADRDGRPVAVQVDERDGGPGYALRPDGRLDPDDEIVWQADTAPLETRTFRVFIAENPATLPVPAASDLAAGPNPRPDVSSASVVLKNAHMEIGVRGWPADPKKWSGAGTGAVTLFRLYGRDQIAQGEGHFFILNNGDLFDGLYDRLDVVAAGPVRAVLQISGPRFDGRREGKYGRCFIEASNAGAFRTYALYDRIPWMEVVETIAADSILPRLSADYRFHWRPGGHPFDRASRMFVPGDDARVETFVYGPEPYGASREAVPEPWVMTARPDDRGVPALFFDPRKTWRFSAHIVEPWMKKGFDESGKTDAVKCVVDCAFHDPGASGAKRASWRWGVWGTRTQDAAAVAAEYRARMVRPLDGSLRIESGGAVSDALVPPAGAKAAADRRLADARSREAALPAFEAAWRGVPVSPAGEARAVVAVEAAAAGRMAEGLRAFDRLDSRARRDQLDAFEAWTNRRPDRSLALQQLDLFRAGGGKGAYAVLVCGNTEKVFRRLACPGEAGAVRMEAARREGESVQLAVVPLTKPLAGIAVTPGALLSPAGSIPAAAWTVRLVGDVKPPAGVNRAYGMPEGTRWPDPLLPFSPFDCPGNEARAVLLTLDVPAGTPPGAYRGTIAVAPAGGAPTVVPVEARISPVLLPERRTMVWDSWYDMDGVVRHYGEYGGLDHFLANMEMLARYRAVPGLYGWASMAREFLDVRREKDGRLTFDFSRLDRWLAPTQKHGNLWNPNASCNSGWFSIFHSKSLGGLVKDRETGRTLTLDDLPEKSAVDSEYTLIYELFMKAYVAHLRERGWLEHAWLEKWDEPVRERIEPCKRHHAYLMKIVPDLKVFAWGMRPVTDDWGWGYTKGWAPNVHAWYAQKEGIDRARREGLGVLAYTCGAWYPSSDRAIMPPDISIWDPNIQRRAYAWLYDRLGLDGLLIFTMNGWPRQGEAWGRKRETRWPASDWVVEPGTTYWLVYPGPDGLMYPSLRLDALRDGFEDYELIRAARERAKARPGDRAGIAAILDAGSPVSTIEVYEQDRAGYDRRKAALLRLLERP